jgi:AraC-like DNA-binding protein
MVNSGHPTVTLQFTKAIVRALQSSEFSMTERVRTVLEQILPHKRVPLPLQDELWRALLEANPEPGLGLKLGSFVQPGNLDIVGFLLLSCDTLEDALDVLLTYHSIVGEGGEFLSTRNSTSCTLIYAPFHEECRIERVEAVIATLVQLSRYLTNNDFSPKFVTFQHAPQMPVSDYEAQLGCRVKFDQLADAVVFDINQLNSPLQQANSELYEQMRRLADEELLGMQNDAPGFSPQVTALLEKNPHWGKERVAEELGMSGRHLNRMLSRESTTFKLTSDQTRLQMAKKLLEQNLTKADIAEQLGFHDESAFTRAFKRWTGMTPAESIKQKT